MRSALKEIIENNTTTHGRMFDLTIHVLVGVTVVCFSIETLPELSSRTPQILQWIEVVTVGVFTAEYLLRVFLFQRPLRYVFGFYGLIDLAAILSFYLVIGLDLRPLRSLRFLRLLSSLNRSS